MQILFSTSYSVIALNTLTSEAFAIERGSGLYYGLTKYEESFILAARRRLVSSSIPRSEERGCLVRVPFRGPKEIIEAPFPLRDVHALAAIGDELLLTCSLDEKIAIYRHGAWSQWHPVGLPEQEGVDRRHLNTFYQGPEGFWIMSHNFGPSEAIRFDETTREILERVPIGVQAHNIWFDHGLMRTCSSGEGRLMGAGLCVHTGGFPRGYASDGRHPLVGLNQFASREGRDGTTSRILMMDMNYTIVKQFAFPDEGMLLDILPISTSDFDQLACDHRGQPGHAVVCSFPLSSELEMA